MRIMKINKCQLCLRNKPQRIRLGFRSKQINSYKYLCRFFKLIKYRANVNHNITLFIFDSFYISLILKFDFSLKKHTIKNQTRTDLILFINRMNFLHLVI